MAEALAAWADETARKLSRKSALAAFRYMRGRRTALGRCFDDGRLALDNNPAERALRCVATERSLYPSSSSICKHWKLILQIHATRATCSPDRGNEVFGLQLQLRHALSLALVLPVHSLSFLCGLDRHGLHHVQNLPRNRSIDARPAEPEASWQSQHQVGAIAPIGRATRRPSDIGHREAPPATPAHEKPSEQRPTAAARFCVADPAIGVGGELLLVAFELCPVDVVLVVILRAMTETG